MSLLRRFGGEDSSQNQGANNYGARQGPPSGVGGASDGIGEGPRYNAGGPAPADPRVAGGIPAGGGPTARETTLFELKRKVQNALISELDPKLDLSQTAQVRRVIEEQFNRILS